MKKILISLFSITLMIGMSNTVNACGTCGCQDKNQEIKKECSSKADLNTKAACSKSKKKCCKSKAKKSGFNYGKSNNYGSKTVSKCSSKKAEIPAPPVEEATEEAAVTADE